MSQEFREHLTELANNMNGIDMYDNVLTASRKRTVRRTVTIACVAVAMIGGLVGVGFAVLPTAKAEQPPANETTKDESRGGIPGQLYYTDESAQYRILDDGKTVESPWAENPAISHDGKMSAHLESGGSLVVNHVTDDIDSFPPAGDGEAYSNQCVWPTWSPTNDQLLYAVAINGDETNLQVQIRDVPSGDLRGSFPANGDCNFKWAADGSGLVAQRGYQGEMVAMELDGSSRREFSVDAEDDEVSLFSVSAGTEEVCVAKGFKHSDEVPYALTCNATVDADTGKPTGTATGGGGAQTVFYTADGRTLIRESTESGMRVTLHNPDGGVLAKFDEPKNYADYSLAQYLP